MTLETVDKDVMRAINKKIDLRNFKKVLKLTRDAGMRAEVFTVYGLPRQTYASACKTLEFLKSEGVRIGGNSSGQELQLYFGIDILNKAKEFGISLTHKKRPLFLSPGEDFENNYMSRQEIGLMRQRYQAEAMLGQMLLNKRVGH